MEASTHRVDPRRDGPNGPTPDLRHGGARSEGYPFSVILRDRERTMRMIGRPEVRTRLSAGGSRIRTIGPAKAPGVLVLSFSLRRLFRWRGCNRHNRISKACVARRLMVRIHLPPAVSLVRT